MKSRRAVRNISKNTGRAETRSLLYFTLTFSILVAALLLLGPKSKAEERFGLFGMLEGYSNLHEIDAYEYSAGSNLWISPKLNVNPNLAITGLMIVSQELTGKTETSVATTSVTGRYSKIPVVRGIEFAPGLTTKLPFAKDQRARETLILGLSARPRLTLDFAPISGFFETTLTRNFHESEISTAGKGNQKYELRQWLELKATIVGRLSLGADLIHNTRWTYQGNPTNNFELGESLSYGLTEKIELGISHSNSGNTFGADGETSQVALFSERSSKVTGSVSVAF